ncbi:sensor histidine kinase [Aequitasia blattaphilus]|uniref:histidine kinase n=1 Tax=Aequitasia blattaphilus TaxID=2949332 RepID=A0ABT1E9W8_9FIRM|nr:HAMP domain-containing sensor histidine kinase [Aequitasia blattaphilus]MCP1102612.1 HAMP domain-containing histidine kinase [Aequitasia blattaphilus]MCR8615252.1 HAMP domain-containing histidine kinase [Aequitasia blattaphilus]
MMVVFIGLMVSLLLVILFINVNFLEKYHLAKKEDEFVQFYDELNQVKEEIWTNQDTMTVMAKEAEKSNVAYLVIDIENERLISNVSDRDRLMSQLSGYMLDQIQKKGKIIHATEKYQIFQSRDTRNGMEYIEMWGKLDDDTSFIFRSPLESIQESATISNQFFIFIGSILIVISSLLVWYFSNRITRPINILTILSAQMANLDFEARYTGEEEDEIGELGANFNRMSNRLEQTILELKKANNDLQQDIVRKEKEEEMRNEFLGNVSHELKTPIALIQGYAEGLKEGIHDDKEHQEAYLDVIIDEANKMNRTVRNLLTLNELEFGKESTVFSRVNLTQLIQSILQSMEILIEQKDVTVVFKHEEDTFVCTDELKIEQVVRNYINNALNHLDKEKVIEIKIQKQEDKIHVSVFNTGAPIPEEDIDHIWDMFYKVDKARTRAYGGNGIGLSIVKAAMESLNQKYGVTNYDNGVGFWFEVDA